MKPYLLLMGYLSVFSLPYGLNACTIVSAVAANGHVWTANNEDGPLGVANFINVFPKTTTTRYGYYTLSYLSPLYGRGGSIQGGMNEAGLSFDFNAISKVLDFDMSGRQAFPEGNDAILPHILANMATVEEVAAFFEKYWFVDGFQEAQMHVSDRTGTFAIISASGTKVAQNGDFLVSTNFNITGNEDGSNCWRYPIAVSKLSSSPVGLSTMTAICKETAQPGGMTMYSNIQNLSTGEIWFFSKHDPNTLQKTTLQEMLSKGERSYTFSDLKSLNSEQPIKSRSVPDFISVPETTLNGYAGNYRHSFLGSVVVKAIESSLEISFIDGTTERFYPTGKNTFVLADYDLCAKFEENGTDGKMVMLLYENGFWSFSVERTDPVEANK